MAWLHMRQLLPKSQEFACCLRHYLKYRWLELGGGTGHAVPFPEAPPLQVELAVVRFGKLL